MTVAPGELPRLWRTLRTLPPGQLVARAAHEVRSRTFRRFPAVLSRLLGSPSELQRRVRLPAPLRDDAVLAQAEGALRGAARLAGHEVSPGDWGREELPKLVRYHLHYLDVARTLAEAGAFMGRTELTDAALALIARWQAENPPGGEGWEPYPVSARLQNLCLVAGWLDAPPASLTASLSLHARYLRAFPERHLAGNHLLKNHCALALTGLLFGGSEAAGWREVGLARLEEGLARQLLSDGGHYERSAMYHLLLLADLLDVRDAAVAGGQPLPALDAALTRMGRFLATILHPDGELPLFNDAVLGQAPAPAKVFARLGAVPEPLPGPVVELPDTGLVVLRPSREEAVVFDAGPLGPEEQPGHAHSDTLSYELSVDGARVAVNAGMDGYQSRNRAFFRSAVAHNTVTVNGEGPDELWAQFRVGGRMRLTSRRAEQRGEWLWTFGALVAFQGWTQARSLALLPGRALVVLDEVEASAGAVCVSRARLLPVPAAPRFLPLRGTPGQRGTAYAPEFGRVFDIQEHSVTATAGPGGRAILAYALAWNARDVAVEEGFWAVVDGARCLLSVSAR